MNKVTKCDECESDASFFHSKCCGAHFEGKVDESGELSIVCEKCGKYVASLRTRTRILRTLIGGSADAKVKFYYATGIESDEINLDANTSLEVPLAARGVEVKKVQEDKSLDFVIVQWE